MPAKTTGKPQRTVIPTAVSAAHGLHLFSTYAEQSAMFFLGKRGQRTEMIREVGATAINTRCPSFNLQRAVVAVRKKSPGKDRYQA